MMFDTFAAGNSGLRPWRMATAAGAFAAVLAGATAAPAATVAAWRDGAGAAPVLTVGFEDGADPAAGDDAGGEGSAGDEDGGDEGSGDGDTGGDEVVDIGEDVTVDDSGRPVAPNYRGGDGDDDVTVAPDFPVGVDCEDCMFTTGIGIGTVTDGVTDTPVAEVLGSGAAAGRDLSGGDACSAGGDPSGCR